MEETQKTKRLLDVLLSEQRKQYPITSGVIDYFPDAIAYVGYVSWLGNQKHNPGEPMHHARGKSADHADCIARHLSQRGTQETVKVQGKEYQMRHSGELAWRALALLQQELEEANGLTTPRGAKYPTAQSEAKDELQKLSAQLQNQTFHDAAKLLKGVIG
jgi:hypothetical protein